MGSVWPLVGFAAIALCCIALVYSVARRPVGRRGPNAHHNADGSVKRKYRSERAARAAVREYERDFGERMAAYRCGRGRHWHIGHRR